MKDITCLTSAFKLFCFIGSSRRTLRVRAERWVSVQKTAFENVGARSLRQRESGSRVQHQIRNDRPRQRIENLKSERAPRLESHAAPQNSHGKADELAALGAADVAVENVILKLG